MNKMIKNTRGFYFTLDALMAFVLLVVVIVLLPYSSLQKTSEYYKTSYLQEDALQIFSNVKTMDVNNEEINSIITDSTYNETLNRDDFLIESVSKLWAVNGTLEKDSAGDARIIASEFFGDVFDTRDNIGLFFSNGTERELIFSENESPYQNGERYVVGATNFISGLSKGKAFKGNTARAFLRRKESTKFVYFGGYIGDGNITSLVDLTGMTNISNVSMEIAMNHDFKLYINGNYAGDYLGSSNLFIPQLIYLPSSSFSYFNNGTNTIEFNSSSDKLSVSGGYMKIDYDTNEPEYKAVKTQYLPGIDGLINIYDSIYSPNLIKSMGARIHYSVNITTNQNFTIFLKIGNITIYRNTTNYSVTDFVQILNDSYIKNSGLDYELISNKTIPVKLGFEEISGNASIGEGTADVIIVTDVSGSMAWKIIEDDVSGNNINVNSCGNMSDPNNAIFSDNTNRISLARCINIEFVKTLLASSGNRVGLVAYEDSPMISSYINLTDNLTRINNSIASYGAGGGTGICGGVRKARIMFQEQSNSLRRKFLVVMTDGLANMQCNEVNENDTTNRCSPPDCVSGNCSSTYGGDCQYRVIKTYDSGESRANIFGNLSKGLLAFGSSSGEKEGFSLIDGRWMNNGSIVSGVTRLGYSTTVYNLINDNKWVLIASNYGDKNNLAGYYWNGSGWTLNNSLVFGLRSIEDGVVSEIVYNFSGSNTFEAFIGLSNGNYKGYYWNGSGWASNNSLVSGLSDAGSYSFLSVAYNVTGSGKWACIIGRTSSSSLLGYQWNNNQWASNSSLVSGLSGDTTYAHTPEFVYNITKGKWFILIGIENTNSNDDGYLSVWDSNRWYKTCGDHVSDTAADEAIDESGKIASLTNYNKTYSIGFGPIEYCSFAEDELKQISSQGNGEYFLSKNATALREMMKKWADEITSLSYSEQASNVSGNFSSKLYPDSYISYDYDSPSLAERDLITYESQNFNSSSQASFNFSDGAPVEVVVTSYSGTKWTKSLIIDNHNGSGFRTVYNLSDYGTNYLSFGDPFRVNIPINQVSNNNLVELKLANLTGEENASTYDKIIYTLSIVSNYSYSKVVPRAQGCNWTAEYYKGEDTFLVPENYSGPNKCYYNSTIQNEDFKCATTNQGNEILENDAIVQATYYLFRENFDKNPDDCKLDIKVSDYYLNTMLLPSVPFLYYSKVEFLSWR